MCVGTNIMCMFASGLLFFSENIIMLFRFCPAPVDSPTKFTFNSMYVLLCMHVNQTVSSTHCIAIDWLGYYLCANVKYLISRFRKPPTHPHPCHHIYNCKVKETKAVTHKISTRNAYKCPRNSWDQMYALLFGFRGLKRSGKVLRRAKKHWNQIIMRIKIMFSRMSAILLVIFALYSYGLGIYHGCPYSQSSQSSSFIWTEKAAIKRIIIVVIVSLKWREEQELISCTTYLMCWSLS